MKHSILAPRLSAASIRRVQPFKVHRERRPSEKVHHRLRTIEYSTITELQKVIDYYLEQVYLEECRRAGRDPRKILVKFV